MRSILSILLVACALQGCGSLDHLSAPNTEGLTGVTVSPKSFTLDKRMEFVEKVGLASVPWTMALEPGLYVAEQENAAGTLYKGPVGCVSIATIHGFMYGSGGLWISKVPAELPRMYWYLHTDQTEFPDRESATRRVNAKFVSGSTRMLTVDTMVTTLPTGMSSAAAGAGAGLGVGIVNAMIANEVRENRGKPGFWPSLHSPELGRIRAGLNAAPATP